MSEKLISGIIGRDGKSRQPEGETERVTHAIFLELTRQQIEYGPDDPLIEFDGPQSIGVHVDIPALLDAIKCALR